MTTKEIIRAAQRKTNQQIGRNLRNLRIARGLSQSQLGQGLGVSFQQIQKFEKGANRLSAAGLSQAAVILDMPPSDFFPSAQGDKPEEGVFDRLTLETARHFNGMKKRPLRRLLASLIKILAEQ